MKLICRKCNKEIGEFNIECPEHQGAKNWIDIVVYCHGEKDKYRLNSYLNIFNTCAFGDVYFFEQEEPVLKKPMDLTGYIKEIQNIVKDTNEMCARWETRLEALELEKAKEDVSEVPNVLKGKGSQHISEFPDIYPGQIYHIAPIKPLTWSKEKPIEKGWYFYKRVDGNYRVYKVLPIGQINPMVEGDEAREVGFVALRGEGDIKYVEQFDGEWAGPIPEPVGKQIKWRRYAAFDKSKPDEPTDEEKEWCKKVHEWGDGVKSLADYLKHRNLKKPK